jgi:hypothetical protein
MNPTITTLTDGAEIYDAIERLVPRHDLMVEEVDEIHAMAREDPDQIHLVTKFDSNGSQTLLVGCVYAKAYFADFALLVGKGLASELGDILMENVGTVAARFVNRMHGQADEPCFCERCMQRMRELGPSQ